MRQLVNAAYERTYDLLLEKKELAAAIAQRLLEKEVNLREDVIEILGERPFADAMTYKEIVGGIAKGYSPQDGEGAPVEEAEVAEESGGGGVGQPAPA